LSERSTRGPAALEDDAGLATDGSARLVLLVIGDEGLAATKRDRGVVDWVSVTGRLALLDGVNADFGARREVLPPSAEKVTNAARVELACTML